MVTRAQAAAAAAALALGGAAVLAWRRARRRATGEAGRRARKARFLARWGARYGYAASQAGSVDAWRARELPSLLAPLGAAPADRTGHVYLDYAGAALPVARQLRAVLRDSLETVLANPHSVGPQAAAAKRAVERAEMAVLQHFCGDRAHEFELVFTSGATASLRLVAELFPFGAGSQFLYAHNSHTSVVGMRNAARSRGASCRSVALDELEARARAVAGSGEQAAVPLAPYGFAPSGARRGGARDGGAVRSLVCCPLECNFTGRVGDLRAVANAFHSGAMDNNGDDHDATEWVVMADIAKAAASGPVDLWALGVDLACVSFYKMFGEPTGLGALIARRGTMELLMEGRRQGLREMELSGDATKRPLAYFGGGSVEAWLPTQGVNAPHGVARAALADGTVHFRGIAALERGFEELARVGGIDAVAEHCAALRAEAVARLGALRHRNGRPVVELYCDRRSRSPVIAFNVRRANGAWVGYAEVSKLAALNRPSIQLRTGCFCNVGACQVALGLTDADVLHHMSLGHRCGDDLDVIDGRPTGAVRASFGKDSIWEDLDALVCFLEATFCDAVPAAAATAAAAVTSRAALPVLREPVVTQIWVYPIKSCGGIQVGPAGWPLDARKGLLQFDREWAVVDGSGTALRMSTHPELALVAPCLDLERRTLTLTHRRGAAPSLELALDDAGDDPRGAVSVCGDVCPAVSFGGLRASNWLSTVLGVRCFLVRYASLAEPERETKTDLHFANEAPLLAISQDSVDVLNRELAARGDPPVDARSFRANLVVAGARGAGPLSLASGEYRWRSLELPAQDRTVRLKFTVTGPCARCAMVDLDPTSGARNGSTLRALAAHTRSKARIYFGVFCRLDRSQASSGSVRLVPGVPALVTHRAGDDQPGPDQPGPVGEAAKEAKARPALEEPRGGGLGPRGARSGRQ